VDVVRDDMWTPDRRPGDERVQLMVRYLLRKHSPVKESVDLVKESKQVYRVEQYWCGVIEGYERTLCARAIVHASSILA